MQFVFWPTGSSALPWPGVWLDLHHGVVGDWPSSGL